MSTPYESFCEKIEEKDHRFEAVLFKFSNAVFVFFYEKASIKLGTLAVAMPQFEGRRCVSSILLGERNMLITRILAERVSNAFREIALVSTHFAEKNEAEISLTLHKLTQRLLDKVDLK